MRTKPLESCILDDVTTGHVRFVSWQPGDGTRYDLVISDLRETRNLNLGGWMVSLVNLDHTCMMVMDNGNYLSRDYVQEKLRCRNHCTVAALAEAIAYLVGRTSEPYTEEG